MNQKWKRREKRRNANLLAHMSISAPLQFTGFSPYNRIVLHVTVITQK